MSTTKDLTQLTEAYEQIVKEGIEKKTITDRLREKAAKNDRARGGQEEKPLASESSTDANLGQYEYTQAERWITQINADVMIGLRVDPEYVIKNINKLIEQLQSLVISVQKFNKTRK
jgi:hypothetical protein